MRPARFISHPVFLEPGFGAHHPLSTSRQKAVVNLVTALGWLAPRDIIEAPLADIETLGQFHTSDYLTALARVADAGVATPEDRRRYNLGTMECPVFPRLWERAARSVGGAIRAADLALSGHVAFHPAGGTHHGRPDRASGFCYFNDPVFAIRRLLDGGVKRVAYVDLDAHHGDGVEAAIRDDDRVSFFSIHEAGRWPGAGASDRSANGRIVNHAVAPGIGCAAYTQLIEQALVPWLNDMQPDGVVVCLGADALMGDPLSTMGLDNTTLWAATARCIDASPHAVVLGGGGYNPWTTARLWAGLWGCLIGADLDHPLPAAARAILAGLDCDLVDPEDRREAWLTTLADMPAVSAIAPKSREM